MIIENHILEQNIPEDIKVERFDMAVNFYNVVKINDQPHLVCYDYNPVWNSWYPFYDDKNKTPVIRKSKSKTFKGLINECNTLLQVDIQEKLDKAKERFRELIGNTEIKLEKLNNFIIYELKYSKTANLYTIYKLFNFVISDAEDLSILLHPKALNCKTFQLNQIKKENLVSNAEYIITHEDLSKYSL